MVFLKNIFELLLLHLYPVFVGQNSWKWGNKILSSKSHSGIEGARTWYRWGHFGNEGANNNQGTHNFYMKLIIVDIDSLFGLYLAIICSVCIQTGNGWLLSGTNYQMNDSQWFQTELLLINIDRVVIHVIMFPQIS